MNIYDQLIIRKANQYVQARLNASVPTLDSSKATEGLIAQQKSKLNELARQAVLRAKREEAEERVKAEGRPPKDEDFRVIAEPDEIRAAAILIAEAVVGAAECQLLVDKQTLEGLRGGT